METNYQAQIDADIEQFFSNLAKRHSTDEIAILRKAYEFAAEAHKKQKRKSGEPYIIHPIAVAKIIGEELQMPVNSIIAAFLHDVVEDTDYTLEDIEERFGDDVSFLVGVVTKPKKEKYEHSKQIDNYRQILSSVHYDIRALLIKLADRLHNMRTLSSMRPDKQMKIAGETDYFYAPLANRLGLYHVKTELENLSFKYRCPSEYSDIETQLQNEIRTNESYTKEFIERIEQILHRQGIEVRAEIRYRRPYSIWRKMQSKNCDFNHVDGKHYIRIIFPDNLNVSEKSTSLKIYAELTNHFKERPGSVSNYIDTPKENGYQSFHVKLLGGHGSWHEIHIASERMVRKSHLGCVAEQDEQNIHEWLDKFKEILLDVARYGSDHDIEFMEGVTSSFYYDDIMVYTPKGEGKVLPKGATALDFAFEIHRDLGLHASYVRINGKLSSIKTPLKRGDCIEVFSDPTITPEEDWMEHVMTYKAKSSLSRYHKRIPRLEYDRCPICDPLPGDDVVGFKSSDRVSIHKRNCQRAIRLASQHGDSIVSVKFEERDEILYPVRIKIYGIDRYHLLSDLIECITEKQQLYMCDLATSTHDRIANCTIDLKVRSLSELQSAMKSISEIDSIDEVKRIKID